jgi:zinc transporter, ZIP family
MSAGTTILLGAIAGFTIFLGLPVGRLRHLSRNVRGLLNSVATGILLFLLWDVLSKASEPLDKALSDLRRGDIANFVVLTALFLGGLALGLMSLIYFNRHVGWRLARTRNAATGAGPGAVASAVAPLTSGRALALMIAVGLGLHNLSEGLAIGQASASGAISFAAVLIIGFGLHNVTEGFGIAAPLAADSQLPSWRFLGLVGLVGGGPTLLGTVIGYSFISPYAFVLFLTLAAGALVYVINEMSAVNRRQVGAVIAGWGIFIGFSAGYGTDLLLTYFGA